MTGQLGVAAAGMASDTAEALARQCGGLVHPHVDAARQAGCALVLHQGPAGLEVLGLDDRPGRGVRADFSRLDIRTGTGNCSRRQPLGRAVGRQSQRVIDATAGLGADAMLLACMGYTVIAVERSPIIAALLADGLARARTLPGFDVLTQRIQLRIGDARTVVTACADGIDAVYVDPMFPPKRRTSALPPKPVQMIRTVVGDDIDAAELVRAARRSIRRVVVKRPTHVSPIEPSPSLTIASKLVRYDVYIDPRRGEAAEPTP